MDRSEKKRLKKQYKEQELKKLLDTHDGIIGDVMSNYAKNELGYKSESLTRQIIEKTDESELIELIYNKTVSFSNWLYKKDPIHFKSSDNVIYSQSVDLIFIYSFHIFQSYHNLGELDNFILSDSKKEIDGFINGLKMLGLHDFLQVFKSQDSNMIFDYFEKNKGKINSQIIKYIKDYSSKFEIE